MAVCDTHVFPGFPTPVLTQLFFLKPPAAFPICLGGEGRKYAGKKVHLILVSNSQPGQESDMLTTQPLWQATILKV